MESKSEMSSRHCREWEEFRANTLKPLLENEDNPDAKETKLIADILKIYQEGERKAIAFRDGENLDNELCVSFEGDEAC